MARRTRQRALFPRVFDASSLINIERSGQKAMAMLRRQRDSVLIPEKVAGEVNQPGTPLSLFLASHPEVKTPSQSDEEGDEFLRLTRQREIHDGEAAAMAVAKFRKLPLVIDERETTATGKARRHGIETYTSEDFLQGRIP
jgi:predicted nucleic acid-binding protein